jgi:hypothetical protein
MWKQTLVNILRNEGCEWCKSFRQREEDFKESIEGVSSIINAEFSLQTLSVEANIPVRSIINEAQKSRNNGIEAVTCINESIYC